MSLALTTLKILCGWIDQLIKLVEAKDPAQQQYDNTKKMILQHTQKLIAVVKSVTVNKNTTDKLDQTIKTMLEKAEELFNDSTKNEAVAKEQLESMRQQVLDSINELESTLKS